MTSHIDKFEYGTWELSKTPRETTKKPGYRYGHLAAIRNDILCPRCDKLHETWAVANLYNGGYGFPLPIFTTIEDVTSYIYEITPLLRWDTATEKEIRAVTSPLLHLCLKHNGIPLILFDLDRTPADGNLIKPGTCANINGYTTPQ